MLLTLTRMEHTVAVGGKEDGHFIMAQGLLPPATKWRRIKVAEEDRSIRMATAGLEKLVRRPGNWLTKPQAISADLKPSERGLISGGEINLNAVDKLDDLFHIRIHSRPSCC